MLGGLAAGLGLAWLASSLGLGAGFANILLIALLAMAGFAAWRMFKSRSRPAGANRQGGFAFEGAGGPATATAPLQYSPNNVGNDASARPWERNTAAFDAASAEPAHAQHGSAALATGSMIGAGLAGAQSWGIPAGFDADGFLTAAKRNFVTLQDAWDRNDITMLRTMMTDSMVGEIRNQLAERETHTGGQPNKTEVVMLDAKLLGIEELPDAYMASVEFSGMIREDVSAAVDPDHSKSGYYFTIVESPGSTKVADKAVTCNSAAADPKTGFFATAQPAQPGTTGTRFFGVDETSLIKQGTGPLADAKAGTPVQ